MYRTYSEWAKLAWDPAEWWKLCWDPTEWMRMGSDCISSGIAVGQRFYGRKGEIEELERLKKRFEEEAAEIGKRIEELRGREAKGTAEKKD